jgi:hypothetical protein
MTFRRTSLAMSFALTLAAPLSAQTLSNITYRNGIAVPGNTLDGTGQAFSRLGMFSDLYYDRNRDEWWGVADRGPGGGVIAYDTRLSRFSLTINGTTGAISNFQVLQTVLLKSNGVPLNGIAPGLSPSSNSTADLGNAFDPEGLVVNPLTGNFLISDEYGPSLLEFDRSGNMLRRFEVPSNLVPTAGNTINYGAVPVPANVGDPALTAGRELNRGYEGLAISPDGLYAYAMLQNGTITDGYNTGTSTRGAYTRIVKYEIATGKSVGQYAYRLQSVGQGRGISAIVALGNDKFMVLERNNRGIGAGATLGSPDKSIFEIDLSSASDITGINLPSSGSMPTGYAAVTKSGQIIDLDANSLPELGNFAPEKMEGFAVGPQLSNGLYVLLMGTDNDFSVTQNGAGTQFDVYFNVKDANPYAMSIQCPIGTIVGCFNTADNSAAMLTPDYALLPGVLQSYTANINGYVPVVTPEPESVVLVAGGLLALMVAARRKARRA